MLSDRGPQFHAWNGVSQFDVFLAEFLIDHTVTKAHHPFTNGKAEAFLRGLEAEVLDVEEFASLQEAEEKIRAHVIDYNFFRTHMGIGGLVPADRYFGMVEEAQRAMEKGLEACWAGTHLAPRAGQPGRYRRSAGPRSSSSSCATGSSRWWSWEGASPWDRRRRTDDEGGGRKAFSCPLLLIHSRRKMKIPHFVVVV